MKILEIDSERRRLSLSIKRVEGQVLPVRPIVPPAEGDSGDLDDVPELGPVRGRVRRERLGRRAGLAEPSCRRARAELAAEVEPTAAELSRGRPTSLSPSRAAAEAEP